MTQNIAKPSVQLIYISTPTTEVSKATSEFVPVALEMNHQNQISGMLLSGESFYLQLIEGDRTCINRLYKNIISDKRHAHPILLRYTEIKTREFGNWSMNHTVESDLKMDSIGLNLWPALSTKEASKSFSGAQALILFRRISALVKVQDL